MRELVMAVGGAALLLGSIAVFLWAAVGLAAPHMVKLSGRGQAVKLWAVSVTMLLLGTIIMPEPPPPTEAELAERRAATEAREAARAESIAERAATEAAREAERVEAREAAAREAETTSVAERERAEAAEQERAAAAQQRAERERKAAAEPTQDEVFEMLTVISNPAWGDHDRMLARYRYVLPRIAENCVDVPNAERAGDMIVVVGNNLHEAGLSDGYPEIADIFHRMTVELAIGRPDFACAETFGSYGAARLQGMEPSEAEKGILAIYRALGR